MLPESAAVSVALGALGELCGKRSFTAEIAENAEEEMDLSTRRLLFEQGGKNVNRKLGCMAGSLR